MRPYALTSLSLSWAVPALLTLVVACKGPSEPVDSGPLPLIDSEASPLPLAPCDPALDLTPDTAWVNARGVLALSATGGTGAYTLSLESDASGGALDGETGAYQAGELTGVEDLIRLTDAGCEGEAEARVQVVDPLSLRPRGVRTLPGTPITPTLSGGSGSVTCSLAIDGSGASLSQGCAYVAGPNAGVDQVVAEDVNTGQRATMQVEVHPDAALRAWGEGGVYVPTGGRWTPTALNGSGEVELRVTDGPFSVEGDSLVAEAEGDGALELTDRYTGEQRRLPLRALQPLRPELPRDGERSSEGVVLPLGDLDGDGYDDVAMGFTEISIGAWYSGAVAIWRGGPSGLQPAPDQLIAGQERLQTLGRAMAAADVNGDGHLDLLLGADRDDRGETNNGAVFVHLGLGDGGFEESPSRSLFGESGYDRFGSAVAACDFDGDGLPELAVGAREASNGAVAEPADDQGAVHVFRSGDGGWSDQADFVLYGQLPDGAGGFEDAEGMELGGALAAADFNGDGLCDLAAGAPETEGGDGAVFIYFGDGDEVLTREPQRFMQGASGDEGELGRRLSAGDVDGDGLPELLASEWRFDGVEDDGGAAHLFLGGAGSGDAQSPEAPAWSLFGESRLERLGSDVQLTDWDGDGLHDAVIGAYRAEDDDTNQGGVLVYTSLALDIAEGGEASPPAWVAWGEEGQGRLGQAVAAFGDADGDGLTDALTLAGYSSLYGVEAGAPWLLSGEGAQTLLELPGSAAGHQSGAALAALDVNGDGLNDLLIGSPEAGVDGVGGNAGAVHAALGPERISVDTLGVDAPETWTGSDRLGEALTTLDFDGDGWEDLVLVARDDSRPSSYDGRWSNASECPGYRSSAGALLVYLGGPSGLDPEPAFIWHGPESSGDIERVAPAGDVNGDGFEDLLAASESWGLGGGFALLHGRGSAQPEVLCDATVWEAEAAFNYLGSALAPMGDIDGDGCAEFAVGARGEQFHDDWYDQGVVRLFWGWGGAGCPTDPELTTLTFKVLRTALGSSLAGGADLDGDGLPDLLVGGETYRVDFAEVGGAWLSPGAWLVERDRVSLSPGALPEDEDWQFLLPDTGEEDRLGVVGWEAGGAMGAAVALLPDPAQTGHALAAVGAPLGDLGAGPRTGGVALYRQQDGGLDPVPWVLMVGDSGSPDAAMGATLLSASFDGVPALVVGAPALDGATPDIGGAFLLFLDL